MATFPPEAITARWAQLHDALREVRAADTVPRASRGRDNAKKVNSRKRHASVGLLLAVVIAAASLQDRDAARSLPWNLHHSSHRIRLIWAVEARERSSEIRKFDCEKRS